MTNELTVKPELMNAMELWQDSQSLEEIKKIFAPKLNMNEFNAFIGLGKATGLNPFLRELWAVKYDEKAAAQIFIGRDGYRKSAQANPNYDYHRVDAVYSNDDFTVTNGEINHSYKGANRGDLLGAYCIVKRRNSSALTHVYVELKEYDKRQSCWNTLKPTMIKKVAEAQALRMAFQEQFAGSLSEYENTIIIDAEWSPEQRPMTKQQKLDSLLLKKGFTNDSNHTDDAHVYHTHDSSITDNDNGLHDADTLHAQSTAQTETCSPVDANGTPEDNAPVTKNADMLCSEAQLEDISGWLAVKGFDESRKKKALKHFNVSAFSELTSEQANEMIIMLKRAE